MQPSLERTTVGDVQEYMAIVDRLKGMFARDTMHVSCPTHLHVCVQGYMTHTIPTYPRAYSGREHYACFEAA